MVLNNIISSNLNLPQNKVDSTIDLLKNGNTIPFIARYRKEVTGNLDEEQIRNISDELQRMESLENRRQVVLSSINEQGKLSDALKTQIAKADSLTLLEDLYQPFRPKRRTRALIAREKGLEPLAVMILNQVVTEESLSTILDAFIKNDVPDHESASNGASDIVAEIISENVTVRQTIRDQGLLFGKLISEKISVEDNKQQLYALYHQFEQSIKYLKPHQVLAINRGEKENSLRVSVNIREEDWLQTIHAQFPMRQNSVFRDSLNAAIEDSARRLLLPSIERDIRRYLTENAEDHAINVFAQNLKALLTQAPLSGHVVLGIDPGFRSGSKIVVVDPTGKLLDTATIYPHPPQKKTTDARQIIETMLEKYQVSLIVIGNGTASRETELFIAEMTKKREAVSYIITSEAGASVYSASKLARKEFPQLDVSIRGAISIARRVQDPLAELVKIDPKSIGVGLYQHDLNQSKLSESLSRVVESVVNLVGIELNTASSALLAHVAGIGPNLAEKIVQHRDENGPFKSRMSLKDVGGMGPKTYEQAVGFIRIRNADNLLDSTAIHPESYPIATKVMDLIALPANPNSEDRLHAVNQFKNDHNVDEIADELKTGRHTLMDILNELARPGRDPREDLPKPLLRKDVLNMDDLSPGMVLKGTIRNVVDFGAFVDIGVKTDGLLHRSNIIKGMHLKVGEIIDVTILSIDDDRNRIALDMKESAH